MFQNFTKYFSHHPLSADTSFKFLSLILFEIWHLQNFNSIFSKGRNYTRGDNSKKKNMRLLFFHEASIHEVSRRYLIPDPHRHPCNLSPAMPQVPYPLSEGAVVTNDWCLCCDYIKKYSRPIGFFYFIRR